MLSHRTDKGFWKPRTQTPLDSFVILIHERHFCKSKMFPDNKHLTSPWLSGKTCPRTLIFPYFNSIVSMVLYAPESHFYAPVVRFVLLYISSLLCVLNRLYGHLYVFIWHVSHHRCHICAFWFLGLGKSMLFIKFSLCSAFNAPLWQCVSVCIVDMHDRLI